MRKIIISLAISVLVPLLCVAGNWHAPRVGGAPAGDSSVFGAVSSQTQTTAAYNPVDGPGTLFGFIVSTRNADWNIVVRDSATASTAGPVYLNLAVLATTGNYTSTSFPFVKLDPPIRFHRGLSLNASACPASGNGLGDFCYSAVYDAAP